MLMNVTVVPSISGKISHVPLKEEDIRFLKEPRNLQMEN